MLTHENLQTLQAYFAPQDHDFLNGLAYITEYAITNRIEQVDPSWQWSIKEVKIRDSMAEGQMSIAVIGTLTICGISRDGAGQAVTVKSNKGAEANEAEKSAVTDALKRAARLFGIGRYLLNMPNSVKDANSLANWMRSQGQQTAEPKPTSAPAPQSAPSTSNSVLSPEHAKALNGWAYDKMKLGFADVTKLLGTKPEKFTGNLQQASAILLLNFCEGDIQMTYNAIKKYCKAEQVEAISAIAESLYADMQND